MRYISDSVISFSIKVKGRAESVRVSFSPLSAGGSSYFTDVTSVMEAMEKSPMFGKKYRRAPECINDTIKVKRVAREPARKKLLEVPSVGSWQDAIDYLTSNFGLPIDKLSTPEAILNEAAANGIVFPELS